MKKNQKQKNKNNIHTTEKRKLNTQTAPVIPITGETLNFTVRGAPLRQRGHKTMPNKGGEGAKLEKLA